MKRLLSLFCFLATTFVVTLVFAHETATAEIDVDVISANDARVAIRGAVGITAPLGCSFTAPMLHCADGLAGRAVEASGPDVAFVRITRADGAVEAAVVTRGSRSFLMPGTVVGVSSVSSVVGRYSWLGVTHVLSGLDHVLFLIALFWQARGRVRALVRTATAFTIAHSVTLGATMLGVLHVRPDVAEACIALSLVLIALDLDKPTHVWLVAAFGLVHGLGFAGAMADTRLPESAKWTALLSFNLGIEGGQLLLFAACFAVARLPRWKHAQTASAYAIGVAGAAMFFLRALSIFR